MDVAAGSHPQTTLKSGREIGDDIAEHIVGDDDLKLARIADNLHA